jgi:predicted transport protein
MPLFQIDGKNLKQIREKAIDLERDLQRITEANLDQLFGLKFVASEFALHGLRIDTLAYDAESKSFVIIEYKRDKSFSVIDQGYAYLALMLNNKADFILEFNERSGKLLERDKVDWTQSRVMFLANSYTIYQQSAINFRDLPIELWEVKAYEGGMLSYTQRVADETKESIQTIMKDSGVASVTKEVRSFSVEDHVGHGSEEIQDLFKQMREVIMNLGSDIREVPKKLYIAYKKTSNFVDVEIRSKDIKLFLNVESGKLNDPAGRARDLAKPQPIGHWGNGDYEVVIKPGDDLLYISELIKQAYEQSE